MRLIPNPSEPDCGPKSLASLKMAYSSGQSTTQLGDQGNVASRSHSERGETLERNVRGYSHAPLSAFGSLPSTPVHSNETHSSSVEQRQRASPHGETSQGAITNSLEARPSQSSLPTEAAPPEISMLSPGVGATNEEAIGHDRRTSIGTILDMFPTTPPGSISSAEKHRSYVGEPVVDMQRLALQESSPEQAGVGEFGRPLKSAPKEVCPLT